jgi:hypothetical protein
MGAIEPRLIVCVFVLLAGIMLLFLIKKMLIRQLGENIYKKMSIFSFQSSKDYTPDPLAEAEVYLAYGRKKRAFKILEKALHENPSRSDVREKLRDLNNEA